MAFPLRFYSRPNCISMVQQSIATIVCFSHSVLTESSVSLSASDEETLEMAEEIMKPPAAVIK